MSEKVMLGDPEAGVIPCRLADKAEFITPAAPQNLDSVLTVGNDGGAKKIVGILDPTLPQDAATKNYVDNHVSIAPNLDAVLTVGNSANAKKITNLAAATNPADAVRLDQVNPTGLNIVSKRGSLGGTSTTSATFVSVPGIPTVSLTVAGPNSVIAIWVATTMRLSGLIVNGTGVIRVRINSNAVGDLYFEYTVATTGFDIEACFHGITDGLPAGTYTLDLQWFCTSGTFSFMPVAGVDTTFTMLQVA